MLWRAVFVPTIAAICFHGPAGKSWIACKNRSCSAGVHGAPLLPLVLVVLMLLACGSASDVSEVGVLHANELVFVCCCCCCCCWWCLRDEAELLLLLLRVSDAVCAALGATTTCTSCVWTRCEIAMREPLSLSLVSKSANGTRRSLD